MRNFSHIFKNQNAVTNDAVKRTIEAVTEIYASRRSINHGRSGREVIIGGQAFPVSNLS